MGLNLSKHQMKKLNCKFEKVITHAHGTGEKSNLVQRILYNSDTCTSFENVFDDRSFI